MNPPSIAFTMSNEILSLIILQAVVALGMIIKAFVDYNNRVQDRLDRIAQAEITRKELAAKGQEREERIIEKINENTEISTKAFDVANGHNAKIAAAVELSKEALEASRK